MNIKCAVHVLNYCHAKPTDKQQPIATLPDAVTYINGTSLCAECAGIHVVPAGGGEGTVVLLERALQ